MVSGADLAEYTKPFVVVNCCALPLSRNSRHTHISSWSQHFSMFLTDLCIERFAPETVADTARVAKLERDLHFVVLWGFEKRLVMHSKAHWMLLKVLGRAQPREAVSNQKWSQTNDYHRHSTHTTALAYAFQWNGGGGVHGQLPVTSWHSEKDEVLRQLHDTCDSVPCG